MCGRFTLRREVQPLKARLGASTQWGSYLWEPRHNIAPTDQVPILEVSERGRQISPMTWGIPRQRGGRTVRQINARAEALPAKTNRCTVVADGFYEWSGDKSPQHQPWFFYRPDDDVILLAAYWVWSDAPGGGLIQTFTIITTAANSLMEPIHDRMPAIIDEGDSLALWLNSRTSPTDLRELL